MTMMKAVVFQEKNRLTVEDVPKPRPGAGEALIRITRGLPAIIEGER